MPHKPLHQLASPWHSALHPMRFPCLLLLLPSFGVHPSNSSLTWKWNITNINIINLCWTLVVIWKWKKWIQVDSTWFDMVQDFFRNFCGFWTNPGYPPIHLARIHLPRFSCQENMAWSSEVRHGHGQVCFSCTHSFVGWGWIWLNYFESFYFLQSFQIIWIVFWNLSHVFMAHYVWITSTNVIEATKPNSFFKRRAETETFQM